MVVEGITDGMDYFVSEIGEIRISGIADAQLNVQVKVRDEEILNENYYPLSDGTIRVYEIGEMLSSYFLLHEPEEMSNNVILYYNGPLSVTIVFTDKQSTIQRRFNTYYSRCRTSVSPSDALFLTHENIIRTARNRMEYQTFMVREGITVDIGIAYLNTGKEKYMLIGQEIDVRLGMVAFSFSLERIAQMSGIDVSAIIYYDVQLKENGVLKDKVRFINDDRQYRNVTNFIYQNAFGMPETMAFTGLTEYSPELGGDLIELLQKSIRADTKYIDSRTVNSGYLKTKQYGKVLDLVTSASLHLYDTGMLEEVVITDIDFLHKRAGSEKINVSLTFRLASRLHLTFKRIGNLHKRIFDKTFDYTFG